MNAYRLRNLHRDLTIRIAVMLLAVVVVAPRAIAMAIALTSVASLVLYRLARARQATVRVVHDTPRPETSNRPQPRGGSHAARPA